jgi:hypothetical protein
MLTQIALASVTSSQFAGQSPRALALRTAALDHRFARVIQQHPPVEPLEGRVDPWIEQNSQIEFIRRLGRYGP